MFWLRALANGHSSDLLFCFCFYFLVHPEYSHGGAFSPVAAPCLTSTTSPVHLPPMTPFQPNSTTLMEPLIEDKAAELDVPRTGTSLSKTRSSHGIGKSRAAKLTQLRQELHKPGAIVNPAGGVVASSGMLMRMIPWIMYAVLIGCVTVCMLHVCAYFRIFLFVHILA